MKENMTQLLIEITEACFSGNNGAAQDAIRRLQIEEMNVQDLQLLKLNSNSLFLTNKEKQSLFLKRTVEQVLPKREQQIIKQHERTNMFNEKLSKIQNTLSGELTKLIVIYVGILLFGFTYLKSQYQGQRLINNVKEYIYGWIALGVFTVLFWLYFSWLIKNVPVNFYLKNLDFQYHQYKALDFQVLKDVKSLVDINKYCQGLLMKQLSFKQLNLIQIKACFLDSFEIIQNRTKEKLSTVILAKKGANREFEGRLIKLKQKFQSILHFSEQNIKLLLILLGTINATFTFFKESHTSQGAVIPLSNRGSILGGISLVVISLYWFFRIRIVRVQADKIAV